MKRAAPRGRRRRRRLQQGQGIFHFVKKVAKNPLVRSIAKKGLEYAAGVYHNLTKRVKNKTLKRILNSDAGHLAKNKGLLNFQIDKFFKDKENEEIKKNYMGVYSMNKITRYINFYEKIKKKKKTVNILLQYLIQTIIMNQESTGGVLSIFAPKKLFFSRIIWNRRI